MYRVSARFIPIFYTGHGFMFPHYTIEYRKHFTKFHSTVVETAGGISIGQTEAIFIYIFMTAFFGMLPDTNESMAYQIDLNKIAGIPFPYTFTVGDLLSFSTSFYLGF